MKTQKPERNSTHFFYGLRNVFVEVSFGRGTHTTVMGLFDLSSFLLYFLKNNYLFKSLHTNLIPQPEFMSRKTLNQLYT